VWQKFAFLELKRPGALKRTEWAPSMSGGQVPVRRSGEKICRQLVKYAYNSGVRYVAACTWDTLVLLKLGGEMNTWCGTEPSPIPAQFQWVENKTEMKRHLYVFLKHALRAFLSEKIGQVIL